MPTKNVAFVAIQQHTQKSLQQAILSVKIGQKMQPITGTQLLVSTLLRFQAKLSMIGMMVNKQQLLAMIQLV